MLKVNNHTIPALSHALPTVVRVVIKSMNKNNSRQEVGSAKNKNEIQEKMKAISVKNKKVRVIVRTMYQIREFC